MRDTELPNANRSKDALKAVGLFTVVCLSIVTAAASRSHGQMATPRVSLNDLDPAGCATFEGKESRPASIADAAGALGLARPGMNAWTAGNAQEATTFHYRVGFQKAVAIGSVFVPPMCELRILRNDAAYPGDPGAADAWLKPEVPSRQGGGSLITLPPNTTTRAILITDRRDRGRSELRGVRLYRERLHNLTPSALAYAGEEFMPPNVYFVPNPASHITAGNGVWTNTGKDEKGFFRRPVVTDVDPTWFMLCWKDEQNLSGLILNSNAEKYGIEFFTGPGDINPRAGTASEWKRIKEPKEEAIFPGRFQSLRWVRFPEVKTRGVRLTITKAEEGPLAVLSGLHTLTDLGDKPAPTTASQKSAPPFKFTYKLPEAGKVTLGIFDSTGKRIRNLAVRDVQAAGEHTLHWDLKDDLGNFVAPGTYRWSMISHPELQVKYEMTVYPNVSRHAPNNSPWLNAMHESGGWLADHSPPCSVCTAGDHAYLGAYVAESGVSLLECDLQGRKTWGHHSFAAWTGPRFLASDGKEVLVAANILGTSNESVWGVDIATKKVRNILSLTPTATMPRGLQGIAAHDGKLYLSVRGEVSYLTTAASADDADSDRCVPLYGEKRKPRAAYEIVTDPRGDFLRLFRLGGTPPGGATTDTNPWISSQTGPSPRLHAVLAFKRPVALGSLAFPMPEEKGVRLTVSVLKANAPYPPDAEKDAQWTVLPTQAKRAWDVIPVPEKTETRALRLTFSRGAVDNDPLANILDSTKPNGGDPLDVDKPKPKQSFDFGGPTGAWQGKIEGMRLLRRRFANVTEGATIRVSSGKVLSDGTWDAQRSQPLTETDPGVYLMEWKTAQSLRGLAIKEIDGELTKIDVFTGSPTDPINLTGMENWQAIADYVQERRDHHTGFPSANPSARYVDGVVDFGKTVQTRAVRLRVVKQWTDNAPDSRGIRTDLGGIKLDPTRCRIWGVAALQYLGGESPLDAGAFERVEVYELATGKLTGQTPLAKPGMIAVNPAGQVFAISENRVVRVETPEKPSKATDVVTDLRLPTALALDRQGNLYVFESAPEIKQVRVYDPTGKFLRSIGKAGGFKPGPWDPERFGDVCGLAVDQTDQLWAVDGQYHPKRFTVWTTAGEFKKELLGNTPYGGGGVLDPEDKTRLFYGPLEFELDWKTGLSRIKNMTWTGTTPAGEVPLVVNGRTYLVTRPQFAEQNCAIVYLYDQGKLKLAAAMGWADHFAPLKDPQMLNRLGNKPLPKCTFLWNDKNSDGEVQAEEVTLYEGPRYRLTRFNSDLGIQSGPVRFNVKEYLPTGVPVYERVEMPGLKDDYLLRLDDGTFYRIGMSSPEGVITANGQQRWTYPQEGNGVQAAQTAKPYRPDQVVSQFGIVGHETYGELGEFVVLHGNLGSWNVWTRDGHLIGPIFRDRRLAPAKPWTMKEHERGTILEDVTSGEEHFSGYMCRSRKDNKIYVVAGHNHISILEVLGLDKAKRQAGNLQITAENVKKSSDWDAQNQKIEVFARAPVVDCYRMRKPPALDGRMTGWAPADATFEDIGSVPTPRADFHIGYDDKHLYLAYRARNLGPLQNSGTQWDRLFKTGAALELQLGTDPAAASDRQAPVKGDFRLLMTFVGSKPMAVLYRPVAPGSPRERSWTVKSPVAELTYDDVHELPSVRMVRSGGASDYILEVAVPLADLGWTPLPGQRLKLDWGVLVSGPNGSEVLRRLCWANRATQITADAPSEARLSPNLWGHVLIQSFRASASDNLGDADFTGGKVPGKDVKKDVTDILDDLKEKPKKK
ncbi:MAG: hypothetical protein K8T89_20265 [Planctomycetes bacterium]|nr:hypothetical protein [Planctomycetota bacterium]